MKTCSYCATDLTKELLAVKGGEYHNHTSCPHCKILLGPNSNWGNYTEDGKRVISKQIKPMIAIEDVQQPLHILNDFHTHDLLLALRLARLERHKTYDLLKTFNKASDNMNEEDFQKFEVATEETGNEYDYWTRRCWMLENLLMDRMGYFPQRISNEMLFNIKERSLQAQKKPMVISRVRRDKANLT